jgi:putative tricarboxylic transport membrane protein
MRVNDAVVGACLIALAIAILVHIQGYPLIPGQKYGPALFPGVIAAGLIACGLLLVRRGVRAGQPLVALAGWMRNPSLVTNFLAICAVLVFYIAFVGTLGFIPTAAACLVALFLKLRVRPLPAIVVAILATLVIHTLFYKLLRVPLPWGVLEPVLW